MQAVEFDSVLTEKGELAIPDDFAARLPRAETLRVIVLFGDAKSSTEDQDWSRLTAHQFLQGYSDKDAIYDED